MYQNTRVILLSMLNIVHILSYPQTINRPEVKPYTSQWTNHRTNSNYYLIGQFCKRYCIYVTVFPVLFESTVCFLNTRLSCSLVFLLLRFGWLSFRVIDINVWGNVRLKRF